jgi:hypothetical protein
MQAAQVSLVEELAAVVVVRVVLVVQLVEVFPATAAPVQ